jgi:hypothetical protein
MKPVGEGANRWHDRFVGSDESRRLPWRTSQRAERAIRQSEWSNQTRIARRRAEEEGGGTLFVPD